MIIILKKKSGWKIEVITYNDIPFLNNCFALQAEENVHFVDNSSTGIEGIAKMPENKKIKKK